MSRGTARAAVGEPGRPPGSLKTEQDVDALGQYDRKGGRYPSKWVDLGPRYNR
jgi:hypothetical protein